jgi:hypothetical protein
MRDMLNCCRERLASLVPWQPFIPSYHLEDTNCLGAHFWRGKPGERGPILPLIDRGCFSHLTRCLVNASLLFASLLNATLQVIFEPVSEELYLEVYPSLEGYF